MDYATITSGRVDAAFRLHQIDLVDRASQIPVAVGSRQQILLRVANRVSEPIHLRTLRRFSVDDGAVALELTDERSEYNATLMIGASANGLRFDLEARGPQPIWMAEWSIDGLDLQEVIVPALGGQVLGSDMPEGESISFKYPFWWNAQFAIGVAAGFDGGLWLRTLDADPRFKMLRVAKSDSARFALTLGIEADAPLTARPLRGTWYLDTFEGSWTNPAAIQREWMTQTFGLAPYTGHQHWPDWAGDIRLVFEVWGMRKDTGRPAHTFRQMEGRLDELARAFPPEHTLLYLPGFAEGGIDSNIPDYNPSEKLGGREGFRRLVDRAHDMGFRVMIHTNVLGMTYSHPLFKEYARYQVVDVFERPLGWAMDLDGDWLTEPYFAYMNPGETAWTDLMKSILGRLIEDFDLDGVFLDQTLLAFNVSSGPNFVMGMRRHVERLQDAFPDVLFSGEGLNDVIQPAFPMAQIHGIDSVTGVHGIDASHAWRKVHPVSVFVFGESTRFVGHLLTKHPSHPFFANQESAYRELGVIPTLVCYGADQRLDLPAVTAVFERARSLPSHPVEA